MDINHFEEIILKAKVEHSIFQNYFYQSKDEYTIHNSLKLNSTTYMLSGLGLFNILDDFKIKLKDEFD